MYKTKIGELSLIDIDEWPVQLADYNWPALRLKNATTASLEFGLTKDGLVFPDDTKILEDEPIYSDEAERNAMQKEIGMTITDKLPERDYISMVTSMDFVGLIETLAKDYPGKYYVIDDDNDILIAFHLNEPIINMARLLMAMVSKIDKWAESKRVQYHIEQKPAWGCKYYSGPDYHPLTKEQIYDLLKKVEFADSQSLASIQIRIVQGIPGMYKPSPDGGPIDEKIIKVESACVRIFEEIRKCNALPDTKYVKEIFDLLNS